MEHITTAGTRLSGFGARRSEALAGACLERALRESSDFLEAFWGACSDTAVPTNPTVLTEQDAGDTRSDLVLRAGGNSIRVELKLDADFTLGQRTAIGKGNQQIDVVVVPDTRVAEVTASVRDLAKSVRPPRVLSWHRLEALASKTTAGDRLAGIGLWSRKDVYRLTNQEFAMGLAAIEGESGAALQRASFMRTLRMLLEGDAQVRTASSTSSLSGHVLRRGVGLTLAEADRWIWEVGVDGRAWGGPPPIPRRRRPRNRFVSIDFSWMAREASHWICHAAIAAKEAHRRGSTDAALPRWAIDAARDGKFEVGWVIALGGTVEEVDADRLCGLITPLLPALAPPEPECAAPTPGSPREEVAAFFLRCHSPNDPVASRLIEYAEVGLLVGLQALEESSPMLVGATPRGSTFALTGYGTFEIWGLGAKWRPKVNPEVGLRALEAFAAQH